MARMYRKYLAEFIGTFTLVFIAVGAAVFGISQATTPDTDTFVPASGIVGVALAFGIVLMGLAYAIGPISGCHVNPAVTVGLMVGRKMDPKEGLGYIVAQFLGGILGGFMLWLFVNSFGVKDKAGNLGSNGYGTNINMTGAFVLEVLLTAIFVFVILMVTDKLGDQHLAGWAIGGTLVAVHLAGIALDGTSVNPARSFGPALFAGGEALSQVWLFILAPVVGGVVAALIYKVVRTDTDLLSEAEDAAGFN